MTMTGLKFTLGIVFSISSLILGILLVYFGPNILYFIRARFSDQPPNGRPPTKKPEKLWLFFWGCVTITILSSALVSSLPDPPPPDVAATLTAIGLTQRANIATGVALNTLQAQYDPVYPTKFVNAQATIGAQSTEIALLKLPTQLVASPIDIKYFDASVGFNSTSPQLYISHGKVFWDILRSGGDQYLYRTIPKFEGNVRLIVVGQINEWTSNCAIGVGLGDKVGSGIAINFGYYGGGCSQSGAVVTAQGVAFNAQENPQCNFVGDWLWIKPKTPIQAELTTNFSMANLKVKGIGVAEGILGYLGNFNTLWIGMKGDGDWPSCSGEIDSIKVEPLP